ncbi:MAG: 5-amino-6-(D-ribitylamino)uracil--L-tyrosine 4-hydroxyphenyl transferase CofH [Pyrinomonadaceae bacterium]
MHEQTRPLNRPEQQPLEFYLARLGADVAFDTINLKTARALDRALAGKELSSDEGMTLAAAEGRELQALIGAADCVRFETVGDVVTYVVNRNINFTNICFVGCRFCAFSRTPHQDDAYFLSQDEITQRAEEAWQRGATEVCVQGGLPRGMDGYHYRDVLRAIKKGAPLIHIHAYSPMEVVYGVERTGMSLTDYLLMLKGVGLDTLPGTAAEILDDGVRGQISRQKLTVKQWVEVITTAHRLGIRTTSTMMYGHVENGEHWVRQLLLLRDMQKETGGFTEFVPLGFVHQNTLLYQIGGARPGPTIEEHLKVHALARLMLRGWIDNIQVSWVKLGRKISQACMRAGANDYGGTLMDENISRLAGATAGEYLSPEEFQERIREIGRIPAERSTRYEILKRHAA